VATKYSVLAASLSDVTVLKLLSVDEPCLQALCSAASYRVSVC
jgi:hypothetical protein